MIPTIWHSETSENCRDSKRIKVLKEGMNRQSTAVFLEQWTIPYDIAVVDTFVKTQDVQCQDWILM